MYVRPLIPHDRERIARLLGQRGIFSEGEIQVALEVIDETLHGPMRKAYQIFRALDRSRTLAGYICFGPVPMTEDCYDLNWIVVDEKFSRKGVGEKLIRFMEEFVTREGARHIYAETPSTLPYGPATSFYEKHGYQVVGVLKDFYRKGDHKMIFMKGVCGRPV